MNPPSKCSLRPYPWAATLILLAVTSVSASAQHESSLIKAWDASDEASGETTDHSAWQEILDSYLRTRSSGPNRFDYMALKASAADKAKLDGYLSRLQAVDPRSCSRAEQKAYWINFYNALTVQTVTEAYPVKSIRNISKSWFRGRVFLGPWNDKRARVAGLEITLDNIENGILRPIYNDDRIHYALNCASIGCPSLSPAAFTADNTEQQLESLARSYVNDPRGVDFIDEDFIVVSSIYDWYDVDYGGTEESVIEHLLKYANEPLAGRLKNFSGSIDYDYDWNLNEP